MPNTDEFWSFNGVSLHEYGWSCATLGGRLTMPPLRGDNQRAAYVPGELWMPKVPDARTITLAMWVAGVDPPTGDAVPDPRLRFNDSWAYLRQVFWNPDAESVLTRRWLRTDPLSGVPGIVAADAMAQLAPGQEVDLTMTTRTRATFAVPLRLAHPFFYGPTSTATLAPGQQVTVANPGDWTAWSKFFYVDFVGPLTAPKLTGQSSVGTLSCGIDGVVPAGQTLTLDVRQFIALGRTGTTTVNRTGEIYNSGNRPWMVLARGNNTLTFTGGGGGHCLLRFRPPYL